MKSLREIQKESQKSDYTRVAEMVGKSLNLVIMVIKGERTDHHNIQKTFSDMLEQRQRLAAREERRRKRMERNRIAA
jgi:hypothetical protein